MVENLITGEQISRGWGIIASILSQIKVFDLFKGSIYIIKE
jgi:hypothetical protein